MKNSVQLMGVIFAMVFSGCITESARTPAANPQPVQYSGPWNFTNDGSYRQVRQSAIDETEIIQNGLVQNESSQKICEHLDTLFLRLESLSVLSADPGHPDLSESVLSIEEQITPFLLTCEKGFIEDRASMKTIFYDRPVAQNLPHSILSAMPVGL